MYDPKSSRFSKATAVWRIMRLRSREGHVSIPQMLGEMTALRIRNGLRPPYYLSAGLYRKSLSWQDKRAHVNEKTYRHLVDGVNPSRYHFITNNKVVTHGLLTTFGIPTPPFFGVVNPASGWTFEGRPLKTASDLLALLRRIDATRVCFKLITGLRGHGFLRVSVALDDAPPTVRVEPGGERLTLQEFWDTRLLTQQHMGYFCQGVIDQHPEVARFNPDSVNTVRTWMFQAEPGRWEMFAAALRMGVGKMATDNLSGGGIGPRLDVATGRMEAAVDRRPERPIYRAHPTTGAQLEGAHVPMWEDVVALCRRTCAITPFLRFLAVDVAFGKEGLLVTEITASPDEHQVGFDVGVGPFLRGLARRSPAPE
jgi:hypothetical protein